MVGCVHEFQFVCCNPVLPLSFVNNMPFVRVTVGGPEMRTAELKRATRTLCSMEDELTELSRMAESLATDLDTPKEVRDC